MSENNNKTTYPLYIQVIIGVVLGAGLGVAFGTESYFFNLLSNAALGQAGQLVIRLLKALAGPLIFFAIVDALLRTDVSMKHGRRLIALCLMNLAVAMVIGLTLMNVFKPGQYWQGHLEDMMAQLPPGVNKVHDAAFASGVSLSPLGNLDRAIPDSLLKPFAENNVIALILLALLAGSALRHIKHADLEGGDPGINTLEQAIATLYRLLVQMLMWVVRAIPFAVFGVVAQVVGKSGLMVFQLVAVFFITVMAGLALHALVYYPSMAKWGGGMPFRSYFGKGADAMITALSTNSSLATIPVTLRCLTEKMAISERSARLSVCIGTNLNNDGIMLYEAMAVLFLAQAVGMDLSLGQQLVMAAASIMVGVGISGVPEAGLIALPLVLSTAGLSDALILTAVPLITTLDWIIARCRSGVNVMNDMLIAILLERLEQPKS